jgi:GTPase SAR1 family protein
MGVCGSKDDAPAGLNEHEKEKFYVEKKKNDEIERGNQFDQDKENKIKKLLLLGAGESGKSTFYKQVVDLYGAGFSEEEILNQVYIVFSNTISSMQTLCLSSDTFVKEGKVECGIKPGNQEARDKLMTLDRESALTPEVSQLISQLWSDEGLKNCYLLRSRIQIPDSSQYFFENAERFAKPDYRPTKQDILRTRVRTTGILEALFKIEESTFKIVDVGGQRSERKKWINCFDAVTAILFVAAISEYDQTVYEDNTTNRVQEALHLFGDICGNEVFKETPIILFLNKKDLFQEKLKKAPLKDFFPEYKGEENFEEACEFMKQLFVSLNKVQDKDIYTHITCATDDSNVIYVFRAVKDIVIRKGLAKSGLF